MKLGFFWAFLLLPLSTSTPPSLAVLPISLFCFWFSWREKNANLSNWFKTLDVDGVQFKCQKLITHATNTHTHANVKGEGSERMRKSNSHVLNFLGLLVVAAHTHTHKVIHTLHPPTHLISCVIWFSIWDYLHLPHICQRRQLWSTTLDSTRLESPRLDSTCYAHAPTHTHLHPLCWQFELLAVALTANNCWWPKGCRSRNEIAVKRTWPRFRVDWFQLRCWPRHEARHRRRRRHLPRAEGLPLIKDSAPRGCHVRVACWVSCFVFGQREREFEPSESASCRLLLVCGDFGACHALVKACWILPPDCCTLLSVVLRCRRRFINLLSSLPDECISSPSSARNVSKSLAQCRCWPCWANMSLDSECCHLRW